MGRVPGGLLVPATPLGPGAGLASRSDLADMLVLYLSIHLDA